MDNSAKSRQKFAFKNEVTVIVTYDDFIDEVAVSIMLADGYEVSDIAIAMSITKDTINTHIANLKSKLNVTNQDGIIVCAYEYEMKLLS